MDLSAPGVWAVLTPSDTVEQPSAVRGIYVGATAGNLVVNWGPGDVTIPVLANTVYPILAPKYIKATGTTATILVGIF